MKPSTRTPTLPGQDVIVGDCRDVLGTFADDYFSACVTDPPYNYEFVGRKWDDQEIRRRLERVRDSKTLVKNLPYGSGLAGGVRNDRWYEAVRRNINEYRTWCESWGSALYRTLRPGAYCLVFNSTRTVAHVQVALETAGFYARDVLVYRRHAGIPKGLNVAKKLKAQGREDWENWVGWHSCLRNEWEAICVVQKPLIDNYVRTLEHSGVGLLRAQNGADGPFKSNIIEGFKRSDEAETVDGHCTVKPLALISHLVELVVPSGGSHVIVDPFAGTGTTCVAAQSLGHSAVGIEINDDYAAIAKERLARRNAESGVARPAAPAAPGANGGRTRRSNGAQRVLFDGER